MVPGNLVCNKYNLVTCKVNRVVTTNRLAGLECRTEPETAGPVNRDCTIIQKSPSRATMAHRAVLISVSIALSQTLAYAARPRIRG